MSVYENYEIVIGLEVHAQLATKSKLFSGSSTDFGNDPNTQTNPVDLGMPGVLPVLNQGAVDMAIKLGLALNAEVNKKSVFARKNYFYPDLPKGYQISQFELPIVGNGTLTIDLEDGTSRDIGVTRAHLEEDAGKSVHDFGDDSHTHVDLNRTGVPLLEIVSEPEMHTPEEAGAYVRKLRSMVRFLGVCDGNMEQGSLRCDANVSVRKKGSKEFGTRAEIKNLNSIRNIQKAIAHEAIRQIDLIEDGGTVVQETRLWDAGKQVTRSMRGKEDAHDYRYFPDPDLLPVVFDDARIERNCAEMPELPDALKDRFMKEYGLSAYDASVLSASREIADYYEGVNKGGKRDPKIAANWIMVELFGALNKDGKDIEDSPVSPDSLGKLLDLIADGTISGKIAKTVFEEMYANGKDPEKVVEEKGLKQISDTGELEKIIDGILADNPEQVAQVKAGNDKLKGWFVGQVMQATKGKANPGVVNKILSEKLK